MTLFPLGFLLKKSNIEQSKKCSTTEQISQIYFIFINFNLYKNTRFTMTSSHMYILLNLFEILLAKQRASVGQK